MLWFPLLNIGVIQANLSESGNLPVEKHSFIRRHIGVEITILIFLFSITGTASRQHKVFFRLETMDKHLWSKLGFRNK